MTEPADQLLIGHSPPMREVRRLVARFAVTGLPVLVTGPTGAGKGLVARALHESSGRPGRYVVANVAALGDGLVDSELFGHVRGAFTGSIGSRRGLIQHADRGTLLLDEVHRLSPLAQPKLLRVLETAYVRPVGSDSEIRCDCRIISAANQDLEALVDAGRFQEDLLARVSRLVIHVPPLRDRIEDVPELAERFVLGVSRSNGSRFTHAGLSTLMEHDWPRNVRELQAVVERAAILSDHPWIDRSDIMSAIHVGRLAAPSSVREPAEVARDGKSTTYLAARRERQLLEALESSGGHVRAAAVLLRVSPNTVYRWMGEFGVPTPERRRRRRIAHGEALANQDGAA